MTHVPNEDIFMWKIFFVSTKAISYKYAICMVYYSENRLDVVDGIHIKS